MNAREELNRLNGQATALAKRRGEFDNKRQAASKELLAIASRVGPDNIVEDPSDDNPALRPRRAELRKTVEALNAQIEELDQERRALEPALSEARISVQLDDAAATRDKGRAALIRVTQLSVELQQALGVYASVFSEADAAYPNSMAGQLAPGRQVPARAGLPLLTGHCGRVDGGLTALLEAIAEHDPSLMPTPHPARIRAERIQDLETTHQNMQPRPIVDTDVPQIYEARTAPAPDPA
jgi:hypothetical protein